MNEIALKAFIALEDDLKIISLSNGHPSVALREQMSLVYSVLENLKDLYPFDDLVSEINFHKHLYSQFRSLVIYYQEKHLVLSGFPPDNSDLVKKHYQSELQRINRFFNAYAFHYKYFSLKASELDALFFY